MSTTDEPPLPAIDRMRQVREGMGRLMAVERSKQSLLTIAGLAPDWTRYTTLGEVYIETDMALDKIGGGSIPPIDMMFSVAWDDRIDDQVEIEQHAKDAKASDDPAAPL